jgi:VanZ family protein
MIPSSKAGRLARIAALTCIMAIVVLSWLPKDMEHRTGLPGQVEHVAAYAGAGLFSAFGFSRPSRALITLVLLAAVLEIGQIWIPGRTSQLVDFAASSGGAALGIGIGIGLLWNLYSPYQWPD